MTRGHRPAEESHRLATVVDALLLKYPRRTLGEILDQVSQPERLTEIGDGRFVRHANKIIND